MQDVTSCVHMHMLLHANLNISGLPKHMYSLRENSANAW